MTEYLLQYTHNEEQKQYFSSSACAFKQFKEILDHSPIHSYQVLEKDKYGFDILVYCSHKNFNAIWWYVDIFHFNTMIAFIIDEEVNVYDEII